MDILRDHMAAFVGSKPTGAVAQVQSTLAKIAVCRTGALGASWHWCADCDTGVRIPNSCGDRHCPMCRGASRAAWVTSAMKRITAGVDYFQVVFTIPDHLSSLTLGNRREMFNLLFRSASKSLKTVLETEQQYEAAASMVLHTWNQKLDAHVHVHAVVPGGGPSLQVPGTWKKAEPPPHERPDRWWLVDADHLRAEFRTQFLTCLRRLHAKGELKLNGDWAHLQDTAAFEEFLAPLEQQSWVTYIQPPPTESSQPQDIVKYLARYLTGGPIADSRVVDYDDSRVTFTARCGTTQGGSNETEEIEVPVLEFIRRWRLHILPKGFTKTRCFGGWSNHHSRRYVAECDELLQTNDADGSNKASPTVASDEPVASDDELNDGYRPCPTCGGEMERLEHAHRTSWKDVFHFDCNERPSWYRPWESSG